MVSIFYLKMIKKHTPLFSGLDSVELPFLLSASLPVPNKLKFVKNPVDEFRTIEHGMYFLLPGSNSELNFSEQTILYEDLKDHIPLNRIALSLRRAKPFSHKFVGMKSSSFFNTFYAKNERLYLASLKVVVDKKPMDLKDFQIMILHLINFYIVFKNIENESPFSTKALNINVKIINEVVGNTEGCMQVSFPKNKYNNSTMIEMRSQLHDYLFDSTDLETLLEFLMPVLYGTFDDDTEISAFMRFKD